VLLCLPSYLPELFSLPDMSLLLLLARLPPILKDCTENLKSTEVTFSKFFETQTQSFTLYYQSQISATTWQDLRQHWKDKLTRLACSQIINTY